MGKIVQNPTHEEFIKKNDKNDDDVNKS